MHERKHRLLKNLFKTLLLLSEHDRLLILLHRLFLKRRSLKLTLTPLTSGTHSGRLLVVSDSEPEEKHHGVNGHKPEKHRHLLLKRFLKVLRSDALHDTHGQPVKLPSMPLTLKLTLAEAYNMGRLIGTGASGSVNLISARDDPLKIYAVKKFRPRLKDEKELDYRTKVKNEFLIGDYLKHQNLIHTMELTQEKDEYLIVMEYCPYDFFNLVMLGLMTKREAFCYTKQIINGVAHLHEAGIAHRDLKLDNCVVDANGVLKLIDFGSVFQFRKDKDASDDKLLLARGIVGSDPYLAPEVFETYVGYDARVADVWSVAIMYCCMILRRFPWKLPRTLDPSYRAFAGLDSMDDPVKPEELLPDAEGKPPRYGPERLLRLLPELLRLLIRGMLELDPRKRFLIGDVLQHDFYKHIAFCRYVDADTYERENLPDQESLAPPDLLPVTPSAPSSRLPSRPPSIPPSRSHSPLPTAMSREPSLPSPHCTKGKVFVRAPNHEHHLVTEKELEKLNEEKQRAKQMKGQGVS